MAKGVFGALKGVDAFGKTMDDVKVKTRTGAFLTLLSAAIILAFTTMEFIDYRRTFLDTSVVVDRSRGEKLTIHLNVTFPRVPCYLLSLDVMDISGEVQRDLSHHIIKTRLNADGTEVPNSAVAELRNEIDKLNEQRSSGYCGSCYGGTPPESGCCNTCDQVRQAYVSRGWSFGNPGSIEQCVEEHWSERLQEQSTEGCNIQGRVRVNKVAGSLQLSPGRSFQAAASNIYDLVPYLKDDNNRHDFSHTIHRLQFAADDEYNPKKAAISRQIRETLGIMQNPLDGHLARTSKAQWMFQYFLKAVSTQFVALDGRRTNSHEYSVTHFERDLTKGHGDNTADGVQVMHGGTGVPGAFFNFEISPIQIRHIETRQSFAHFLTSTCAIVGGVLTVASIVDGVLFATQRSLKKKSGIASGNGHTGGKMM